VGDPESQTSPAAMLGALTSELTQLANTPDDPALASSVLNAAQGLAATLNGAAAAVQRVRSDADTAMADSVTRINDLLGQFEIDNKTVVRGTALGLDVTDALDRRDKILSQLSEELGISVVTRENNDLVIYADGGATLFETSARPVTFTQTPHFGAGTSGQAVFVDGVAVTGESATMPLRSGRLVGLSELRDETSVAYQKQIDEVARALIETFAETDQNPAPPNGPALAGLFTAGSAALPTDSTGLAASISINAAVDPARGGILERIRDGGINGGDYAYNAENDASFSVRLRGLGDALAASRSFDPDGQIPADSSLIDYATASVAWLEGLRSNTSTTSQTEEALLFKASDALSNVTGISMDEEYAKQLEYERSYQASSKLIAVIGELFDALFSAVG
jgi:flagellar hook-associated protein 1 FlgK